LHAAGIACSRETQVTLRLFFGENIADDTDRTDSRWGMESMAGISVDQ
jgi:hypothetical protein